ncbi:MAG: hypothetical protein F6K39_46825 [Okeania sp. SIO3B3]|nr:hypothetical protein [Okeania sp. SIO3B3]
MVQRHLKASIPVSPCLRVSLSIENETALPLPREQDAPTAMLRNKNNYNTRPLQCTTREMLPQSIF